MNGVYQQLEEARYVFRHLKTTLHLGNHMTTAYGYEWLSTKPLFIWACSSSLCMWLPVYLSCVNWSSRVLQCTDDSQCGEWENHCRVWSMYVLYVSRGSLSSAFHSRADVFMLSGIHIHHAVLSIHVCQMSLRAVSVTLVIRILSNVSILQKYSIECLQLTCGQHSLLSPQQ